MTKNKKDDYKYYQEMTLTGLVDIQEEKKFEYYNPDKEGFEVLEEMIKKSPYNTSKVKEPYTYIGSVYRYDKEVFDNTFECHTKAVSEEQALNNVLYQVKMKLHYTPGAPGFKLKGRIYKDSDY